MPAGSHRSTWLLSPHASSSRKPSYSISKHAQGALTEAFRHELRPLGIRVTNVMPGPTWSASWEGVEFPENRLLDAKHIAEAVWQASQLPPEAVMEELVIRPFEGTLIEVSLRRSGRCSLNWSHESTDKYHRPNSAILVCRKFLLLKVSATNSDC